MSEWWQIDLTYCYFADTICIDGDNCDESCYLHPRHDKWLKEHSKKKSNQLDTSIQITIEDILNDNSK